MAENREPIHDGAPQERERIRFPGLPENRAQGTPGTGAESYTREELLERRSSLRRRRRNGRRRYFAGCSYWWPRSGSWSRLPVAVTVGHRTRLVWRPRPRTAVPRPQSSCYEAAERSCRGTSWSPTPGSSGRRTSSARHTTRRPTPPVCNDRPGRTRDTGDRCSRPSSCRHDRLVRPGSVGHLQLASRQRD